jgi:uncharacterized membrane protein YedE/YeeE
MRNPGPARLLPGLVAFAGGIVFAVGLCFSGMTQPAKVIGFLDVSRIGSAERGWDPSLALVMIGAIAVHFAFARRARLGKAPLLAPRNELPTASSLDARLYAGATLFGIGWGIAGFCPGPAVVSVVTGSTPTLVFVAAMLAGMALQGFLGHSRFRARQSPVTIPASRGSSSSSRYHIAP